MFLLFKCFFFAETSVKSVKFVIVYFLNTEGRIPPGCCGSCTCPDMSSCSIQFAKIPPFNNTLHVFPFNLTLSSTDPTTLVSVSGGRSGTLQWMWGPNGWDKDVEVWQFIAKFGDSQDLTVSFDKSIGNMATSASYGEQFSTILGQTPAYVRAGLEGLDFRPG